MMSGGLDLLLTSTGVLDLQIRIRGSPDFAAEELTSLVRNDFASSPSSDQSLVSCLLPAR